MKNRYLKTAAPALPLFALGLYSALALIDRDTGFCGKPALPIALAAAAAIMAVISKRCAKGEALLKKGSPASAALFLFAGAFAVLSSALSIPRLLPLEQTAARTLSFAASALGLFAAAWYVLAASALRKGYVKSAPLAGAPIAWCCVRVLASFVSEPVNKYDFISLAGLLSPLALAALLVCFARAASLREEAYLKKLPASALAGVYLVASLAFPYAAVLAGRDVSGALAMTSDALCALAAFAASAPNEKKEQGEKEDV